MNHLLFIRLFILILIIPSRSIIFAQTKSSVKQQQTDSFDTAKTKLKEIDTIFFEVPDTGIYKGAHIEFAELPKFPGGDKAVIEYVLKNTNYPQTAIKDSIEGNVVLRFVIDVDGSTTDIKPLRAIRSDLDDECIRVVKGMPKWKPGTDVIRTSRGLYRTTVKVWYSISFNFSLTNDEKKRGIIIKPRQIQ